MINSKNKFFLKYSIPCLMVMVIAIQSYCVNVYELSRWKGGGYGMYSEIHYVFNQIYIDGESVDSLVEGDDSMKNTLGYLKLMPNKENLRTAAEHVLDKTNRDSIHIQIWKPTVNSENSIYSKVLIDELYLKK